jgi:hypothetical protein
MTENQPPRQNRDGHPCPQWCVTDHSTPVSSLSHWGAAAAIELPGTGWVSVRAAHLGSAADRAEVSVSAFRHGGPGGTAYLRLTGRDAEALAVIVDMLDDWDEVRALIAGLRKAAADITDADGLQP